MPRTHLWVVSAHEVEATNLAEFLNCEVVMPVQTPVEEVEEEGETWKVSCVDYMHWPKVVSHA